MRILEAYRNTVATLERGELTMHLGHDADGIALEIGLLSTASGPVIVHAMRMRRAWEAIYRRFLS